MGGGEGERERRKGPPRRVGEGGGGEGTPSPPLWAAAQPRSGSEGGGAWPGHRFAGKLPPSPCFIGTWAGVTRTGQGVTGWLFKDNKKPWLLGSDVWRANDAKKPIDDKLIRRRDFGEARVRSGRMGA